MIGFWKVTDLYGCFSNWYLCKIMKNGLEYCSSEQALMWEKAMLFNDKEIANQIMQTNNQAGIKALGRKVKNFDENIWAQKRYQIMVDILICKFRQNKDLKDKLMSTGDSELFECSPYDKIWGIGSYNINTPNGQNLLGKALMEVREKLR